VHSSRRRPRIQRTAKKSSSQVAHEYRVDGTSAARRSQSHHPHGEAQNHRTQELSAPCPAPHATILYPRSHHAPTTRSKKTRASSMRRESPGQTTF
jgi:hypothetical protein